MGNDGSDRTDLLREIEELRGKLSELEDAARLTDLDARNAGDLLLKERERVQSILDIAGVMFIGMDTSGTVTLANRKACDVLGYDETEIIGSNWFDAFIPERDRESVREVSKQLIVGDLAPPEYHENPVLTRDGDERIIAWHNRAVRGETGSIIGHISSGEDITSRKHAEQAHMESEEKYRNLFDNLMTGIGISLLDGRILAVNPSMSRITGYSSEEIKRINLADMYVDIRERERLIETIRLDGEVLDLEGRYLRKDGSTFWASMSCKPIEYDGEQALLTSLIDITSRKSTEEALVKSEERFRAVMDTTTDFVFTKDIDSRYTYVNPAMASLLGCRPEDLIGKTPEEVFDPEYAKVVSEVDRTALSGETADEVRTLNMAGMEFSFHTVQTALLDHDGSVSGICGIVRDISKRRNAEIALEDKHNQLLSIFDSMEEVIYVADPETHELLYFNRPAIENWGDRIGEKCYRVLQNNDEPCSFCSNGEIFGENLGKTHIWEFRNLVNDRLYRCIDRAIEWTDGRHVRYEQAIDITDLRKAENEKLELERQIQHAQKLESLGVLAGGIAHDFNNILMAIMGNADIALMDLSTANPVYANVKEIETAAKRAADLARQMLAYSGKGRFLIENINLNEAVEEMTHMLEVLISKKAVIKYHFAENLPLVEADATQIRQIIMNLVTNSSDAIDRTSGVISITTGALYCDSDYLVSTYMDESLPEGLYVYLEVTDTGSGMNRETLEKLFDPFYSTKFTGRGLGLSAVLGIIRGHCGAIKIYSEMGKGTSIKVLFPACDSSGELPDELGGKTVKQWTGSGTILLVDDEESVVSVGAKMLQRLGFNVLTASDGLQAVDRFREHSDIIDLVILDLTMPHLDGEEAFRELRRIRGDIRVLMSSGYNQQEVTQRFAGKPLAGFLQKPYVFDELEAMIRDILD